ncbi:MAG: hypothetical protein M1828_005971 [Chrysothrix sp. TS-e1954]|nr:MAG: hypothetical protein M1828_005971 [Chrysothrix sp. TS-e1954]
MPEKTSPNFTTAASSLTLRNDVYRFIDPSKFKGKLAGKVVVVTGAGRGIGRACALAFASAGASVACIARRQQDIDRVVEAITSTHWTPACAVAADVAIPASSKKIVAEVTSKLGAIDILANVAGMTRFNMFEDESEGLADWWSVIEVNLRGCINLIHAVLPDMLARRSGTIISVTSTSGSMHIPFTTAYSTSKAALIKFTQDLDVEVRDRGICSYTLHPGSVATDIGAREGAIDLEKVQKHEKMMSSLQRFQDLDLQTPELAAYTFVALCVEKDAKWLSGKYIDVQRDLEETLGDAKKGSDSRIEKERLFWLKMEQL